MTSLPSPTLQNNDAVPEYQQDHFAGDELLNAWLSGMRYHNSPSEIGTAPVSQCYQYVQNIEL